MLCMSGALLYTIGLRWEGKGSERIACVVYGGAEGLRNGSKIDRGKGGMTSITLIRISNSRLVRYCTVQYHAA